MMENTVKIVKHPTTGAIITPMGSGEYSAIRVDSEVAEFNSDGFMNTVRRSALIKNKTEDLTKWVESMGLKEDSILKGKIVVEESHIPYYEGQEAKINPTTKEIVLHNGKPVYRKTYYSPNVNTPDVFIGDVVEELTPELG